MIVLGLGSGPDGSAQAVGFIWSLFRAKRSILDPFRAIFDGLGDVETGQMSSVETQQMSSVETEHMFSVETGQMSSVETGQMFSVETGQMSAVETGQMTAAETSVLFRQKTSVPSEQQTSNIENWNWRLSKPRMGPYLSFMWGL